MVEIGTYDPEKECEYCKRKGATFKPDPFAQEIDNDDTPHWICDECAEQHAMDV